MNYDRAINVEYANFRHGMDIIYSDPVKRNLYKLARDIYRIIHQNGSNLMSDIRVCDLKADACDGIHNVDATMYQYIKNSNPGSLKTQLEQVEKLGESV